MVYNQKPLTELHTLDLRGELPREQNLMFVCAMKDCNLRTMTPRKPRAPPPLSALFLQISRKAALVNRISTPENPKSAVYWLMSDPRTSVRIRRRSEGDSGVSVVIVGSRDINSGMKLIHLSLNTMLECQETYPYLTKSAILNQ